MVTKVGDGAFWRDKYLRDVNIGIDPRTTSHLVIGNKAFAESTVKTFNFRQRLSNIVIDVGEEAFKETPLRSINLNGFNSIIRKGAFQDTQLESVDFSYSGENSEVSHTTIDIGEGAFQGNNKLESVNFSNTNATIGEGAFRENELTSVEFGTDELIHINEESFANNYIKHLELSANVTIHATEGKRAFANNKLETIVFNQSKVIPNDVFADYEDLKWIQVEDPIFIHFLYPNFAHLSGSPLLVQGQRETAYTDGTLSQIVTDEDGNIQLAVTAGSEVRLETISDIKYQWEVNKDDRDNGGCWKQVTYNWYKDGELIGNQPEKKCADPLTQVPPTGSTLDISSFGLRDNGVYHAEEIGSEPDPISTLKGIRINVVLDLDEEAVDSLLKDDIQGVLGLPYSEYDIGHFFRETDYIRELTIDEGEDNRASRFIGKHQIKAKVTLEDGSQHNLTIPVTTGWHHTLEFSAAENMASVAYSYLPEKGILTRGVGLRTEDEPLFSPGLIGKAFTSEFYRLTDEEQLIINSNTPYAIDEFNGNANVNEDVTHSTRNVGLGDVIKFTHHGISTENPVARVMSPTGEETILDEGYDQTSFLLELTVDGYRRLMIDQVLPKEGIIISSDTTQAQLNAHISDYLDLTKFCPSFIDLIQLKAKKLLNFAVFLCKKEAYRVHTDLEPTGNFESSNENLSCLW